jgi:acyl-CoA dehydrogenase
MKRREIMIDFRFSPEQKALQAQVREFCQREIAPGLRKMDADRRIPESIIQGLAELRVLGLTVSTAYGGREADPVTVGLVAEEIARADISCAVPTLYLVEAAWGSILDRYGPPALKEERLPAVTQGRAFLGIAATEPGAGSDLAAIRTTARKEGDRYVLNGSKIHISGVDEVLRQLPEGGGFVTLARTDAAKGAHGMSLLYVPLKGSKGITSTLLESWGRRSVSHGAFGMKDVEVPAAYLIGEENGGFRLLMEGFDYARAVISVVCCGAAMSALDQAVEHIKKKTVFGRPIGWFEGVQFRLAEHVARLEATRLLGYRALWMHGLRRKGEPEVRPLDVTRTSAEAKLLAPAFAFEAVNDAIQWYGAAGYTDRCPLELALKGVRSYYWAEGALEIMRVIVARELLGKEFIAYR